MVIGGFTNKLEYSAKIELFKIATDGSLTAEQEFELPADRVDAEDISKKKGDLGCMYYRWHSNYREKFSNRFTHSDVTTGRTEC